MIFPIEQHVFPTRFLLIISDTDTENMKKQRFPLYLLGLLVGCASWTNLQAQVLQNMVKNPSFEQYEKVPSDLGHVDAIDYWSSPTAATPDYFHKRASSREVDVPLNKMGRCHPRSGYAYAGIYAYASRYIKQNFREYVQVELKQPLLAGQQYCIKAHVFLSQSSNRAVGSRYGGHASQNDRTP